MKIKLYLLTFLLISLSGCALAKSQPPVLDNEIEPFPVGLYVAIPTNDSMEIPPFNVNDKTQTYFLMESHIGEDNQEYSYSTVSGQFMETHTHTEVKEESETITFTAKLPFFTSTRQLFRFYTIYKNEQGQYYTQMSESVLMDMGSGAIKFEYDTNQTVNGVNRQKSIIFDIGLKSYDPLQSLQLIMMNEQYEVIDTLVIKEESDIPIGEDIAYVLIEEVRLNIENKTVKTLTMVDANQLKDIPYYHTMITSPDYPRGMVVGLKLYK